MRKCINQMANLETRVDNSGLDKIGGRIDKIQASFDDRREPRGEGRAVTSRRGDLAPFESSAIRRVKGGRGYPMKRSNTRKRRP